MRNAMFRENFKYFRKVWGPRAAFHLANVRDPGPDYVSRMVSAVWLFQAKIPLTGAAPSMNFSGLAFGSAK